MSSLHNPVNFFRIILPFTLERGKLPLPKGFGRKYETTLSSSVLIKLPNGGKWEMNWTMHDGQIWFENGWKEFVKFYSISVGYFLVFKYDGNSHFQVLIFDTSCLEIAYPVLGIDDDESNKSDSVEVIHGCNKARQKSPVPCSRPHKLARTNPVADTDCFDHLDHNAESSRIGRKRREKIHTRLDIDSAQKRFKGNGEDSFNFEKHPKREIKSSKEPLSFQNLFSFDVQMYRTYLTTNCLCLPRNHGMNCLSKNEGPIILRVSDEKNWPVSYKFSNGRGRLTNVSIRRVNEISNSPLSQGEWATKKPSSVFHEQVPQMKPVCSSPHMKAKVSRVDRRKLEKTQTHLDTDAAGKRFKEYETNRSKEPLSIKKPFAFDVEMHHTFLTRNLLYFPYKRGINYLSMNEETVILQVSDGKTWPVSYKFSNGRGKLTNGWVSFVRVNNLKEGDVCSCKMIESNSDPFIVSIWRVNEVSTTPASQGNGGGSFYSGKHSKCETKRGKQTLSFEKPLSFDVQMYRTYLTTNCLHLPHNHGMTCLSKNEGTIILRVSDEKTWPISYKFSNGRGRLTTGWLSFVRENNLKRGDVCNFKIIESNGISFVVYIRRVNEISNSPLSQGEGATNKLSSTFNEQVPPRMHVKSEVQKACSQFKSDNGFPIFIRSCLLENTRPSIPIDFIRRYIKHNEQCVILQVGRKSFLVKLAYNPNKSYARFTTGWSSFVGECGLKAGDVCHFQLIDEDEGKLVLKVSIERNIDRDA
ncbi:hypothetical protein L6164_001309 [Bauhinia variegata]|uniref:Uncharacterized protein n=1 Tax=Bauhinia variegata TaxID=167791 RepID=A0ACB9Q909_BAUVA|nr:hypothetical protein L6164_001309 [Bauhinia variegata]